MNNLNATRSLCNAIANTFYPDNSTIELALFNEGIDANADATPKDVKILKVAASLCIGYVEASRSEGSVSTSVREDAVKDSIKYWANIYGADAAEVLGDSVSVIEDGTHLW